MCRATQANGQRALRGCSTRCSSCIHQEMMKGSVESGCLPGAGKKQACSALVFLMVSEKPGRCFFGSLERQWILMMKSLVWQHERQLPATLRAHTARQGRQPGPSEGDVCGNFVNPKGQKWLSFQRRAQGFSGQAKQPCSSGKGAPPAAGRSGAPCWCAPWGRASCFPDTSTALLPFWCCSKQMFSPGLWWQHEKQHAFR